MPQKDLWRGEETIRNGLQAALDQARDNPTQSVEQSLQVALQEMSAVLYQALGRYPGFSKGPDVYFWPGYNSVLARLNTESRLTLKDNDGRACGIGFCRSSAHRYYNCHGQLAFSRLLVRTQSDRLATGAPFSPGGTHAWISAAEWTLPQNVPLNVLAIEILKPKDEANQHPKGPDNGILWIPLRRDFFSDWGNTIAEVLNDKSKVRDGLAHGSGDRVLWPYAGIIDETHLNAEDSALVTDLRLKLYSAWLASNLCVSEATSVAQGIPDFSGWIQNFAIRLREAGLERLSSDVGSLLDLPNESHSLPYWYTFNLGRTVSTRPNEPRGIAQTVRSAGENELGSLMMLSSKPIPPAFFTLTKAWVERIYTWMRAVESSILTLRAGAESQSFIFAHQITGLTKLVIDDRNFADLSPGGRSAAWHLHAVARVWSEDNLEGDRSLMDSEDSFWHQFGSCSTLEFLKVLIDQAMGQTFRKARLAPDRPDDQIGKSLQQYARAHSKTPKDAHDQLKMIIDGEPPDWIKTEGFIIAFHHCFWQAAYHGLRASLAELPEPYLWIECSNHRVVIYNRAAASEFSATPHDWLFFRLLEERLAGFLTIEPELREAEGLGVVTISKGGGK